MTSLECPTVARLNRFQRIAGQRPNTEPRSFGSPGSVSWLLTQRSHLKDTATLPSRYYPGGLAQTDQQGAKARLRKVGRQTEKVMLAPLFADSYHTLEQAREGRF